MNPLLQAQQEETQGNTMQLSDNPLLQAQQTAMGGNGMTSGQSAAALGHANGLLSNLLSGAKDVATGVAKSELGAGRIVTGKAA